MKTYEFAFRDGQRLIGEGNDPAEALLDTYRRNGFLPLANIIERIILKDDSTPDPPEAPALDMDPGIDLHGRPAKKKGR